MSELKKIKSALISVYHKDGLDELITKLDNLGVKFYSTGGTKDFIESLNVAVTAVEELTTYPSILGGRVKTLHPKVFGGILARRENDSDIAQLAQYDIPEIDLVIVDLYPFEATVASGASDAEIIEKIDIGGISLIRVLAPRAKFCACTIPRPLSPMTATVIFSAGEPLSTRSGPTPREAASAPTPTTEAFFHVCGDSN